MLTKSQVLVADVDDTVEMHCQFEEEVEDQFNLFDNPVHWRKSQLDEQTQMNMMVNLLEPFIDHQRRVHVSFRSRTPNYTMSLIIARTCTRFLIVWRAYRVRCLHVVLGCATNDAYRADAVRCRQL
jgi:hypothetical protein